MSAGSLAPERPANPWSPALRPAVVHDWFGGLYGAERVADVLVHDVFAGTHPAKVFTFHADRERLPPRLNEAIVRESRLARLPGLRDGAWRYLLPLMPRYFAGLPLDEFDLVVSSSHACAVNARPAERATHVCYCHTPMRYAWMPDADGERGGRATRLGLRVLGARLRRTDRAAARQVDGYVANSSAVRERIRRFYGRDAEVIHPPVQVGPSPQVEKQPGRFLWVHRLVSYKRPELVAEAFRDLPFELTMVGVGPLEARLRRRLPPNVELRGWVPREELRSLYASASGFVHIAEEDFGITMVEALAAGTPVVALDRGGARDIVRPGEDGILIDSVDLESLRRALRAVAAETWDAGRLVERARLFSREAFVERFTAYAADLHRSRSAR